MRGSETGFSRGAKSIRSADWPVKRKNPQNILPLSPTARKGKSPAAHTRATHECARRRHLPHRASLPLPPTPSLAAAAYHASARRRPPAQRRRLPPSAGTLTTDAPSPAVPRRCKMWPILAPHRLQLRICAHDSLGFGVPAAGTKSSRHCSCTGLHSRCSPLFQVRGSPAPRGCTLLDSAPFTRF